MHMNTDNADDVMFSRTGMVSPLGTLTEDAKTKIDFKTMEAFRALVNDAGMDVSGALRDWIYLKVHGQSFTDFCVHAAKVKSAKLFGEGPNDALIVPRE